MTSVALITYELNQGGTNRVLCHLAGGFAAAGYQTTIISCTSQGANDGYFGALLGDRIDRVSLSDVPWASRTWGQVRSFLRFRKWLRQARPDILLATGNNISWFTGLGALILGRRNCALFIKTTNPIVRERDSAFIQFVRRIVYARLFRASTGVLTLSDAETRLLQSQFPRAADKFETVYNAYMSKEFEALDIVRKAREPVVILGVGRLVAQKNFTRLLRAFALAGHPTARLRIAGEGEERHGLESLAAHLGIADRVEFLGYRRDIPELMAAADLFVLSSDYEGLPAVVVEALACDCPVIATDCFANATDLLEGLPGCHVTGHGVEELAEAIGRWLEKPVFDATLRPHALRYTTASAVRSHLEAMKYRTDNDHRRPEVSDDLARPAVPAGA